MTKELERLSSIRVRVSFGSPAGVPVRSSVLAAAHRDALRAGVSVVQCEALIEEGEIGIHHAACWQVALNHLVEIELRFRERSLSQRVVPGSTNTVLPLKRIR